MLTDSALGGEISALIHTEALQARSALASVIRSHIRTFEDMEDTYLRERAADVRDLGLRVLAAMNLRKPSGDDGILRKGIDIVFALDVSTSMLATDIAPNRLELARQFLSQMIRSMPENRIGLVLFAGKAYLQMPISGDHSAAQMFVANASPDLLPVKGTVLASALEESLKAFGEYEAKYKAVVLISDGEDHDEKALQVSKDMALRGLMVNTVGIGSPQGAFVPDTSGTPKLDPTTGKEVISKLNEAELQQIAANTRGVYVHLTNPSEAIKKISASLSQIDKKVTGDMCLTLSIQSDFMMQRTHGAKMNIKRTITR